MANVTEADIKVTGMTCHHCVMNVTEALQEVPGVETVEVSLDEERAHVAYDPGATNLEALAHAIEEAGYHVA